MGASGAGKTTLMDCLAGRKTSKKLAMFCTTKREGGGAGGGGGGGQEQLVLVLVMPVARPSHGPPRWHWAMCP